ncbi:MAG: hypothetical protein K1Y36_28530, partial [Blastocatellia bacterium]|nr:hypothetical protein [Blastocatellia bacterium]
MKQPVLFETHVVRPEIETGEPVPLPDFEYISSAADWALWESRLKEAPVWGVDLETTGLDPLTDSIRLVQIAAPGCPVLVCDLFRIGSSGPMHAVLGHPGVKILQNAKFDLKFLAQAGISLGGQIFDTMLAGQLVSNGKSGARHGLNVLVTGYLGQTLSKEERLSDWAEPELSEAQLHYAARD